MTFYISYKPNGRTGNNLFQYFACKIIGYIFGHDYKHDMIFNNGEYITLTDEHFAEISRYDDPINEQQFNYLKTKHILCDGYFQNSALFIKWRKTLLMDLLKSKDILHDNNCGTRSISDFMKTCHTYNFTNDDIAISLRLDDFYQAPCKTSDIIPPDFYTSLLHNMQFNRLFIIVDKPRHSWEHAYLSRFNKWNPILISGSLEHDAAVMRSVPRLIHSNSTLCWLSSFMSNKISRHIPRTNFYKMQKLGIIDEVTDIIYNVNPLPHEEVHKL